MQYCKICCYGKYAVWKYAVLKYIYINLLCNSGMTGCIFSQCLAKNLKLHIFKSSLQVSRIPRIHLFHGMIRTERGRCRTNFMRHVKYIVLDHEEDRGRFYWGLMGLVLGQMVDLELHEARKYIVLNHEEDVKSELCRITTEAGSTKSWTQGLDSTWSGKLGVGFTGNWWNWIRDIQMALDHRTGGQDKKRTELHEARRTMKKMLKIH